MTIGLDTSVILRLLLGEPASQATSAIAFLDDLQRRGGQACVSDLVVAEAYFALQFHYGITKSAALRSLSDMLQSGEVKPVGQAGKVLAQDNLATAKPGMVDRLIHAEYQAQGASMLTFEKAAIRLEGTQLLTAAKPK